MMQSRFTAIGTGLVLAFAVALSAAPAAHARQGFDTATLPDLGDSGSAVFGPDQQARIGREVMRQIEHSGALLDDPDIEEYIQGLGQHLAAHADRTGQHFRFFVIRSDAINAFALPGGYIGINAGLILAADSEAELAGVVAHEIAHVTQNHIARQIEGMQGGGLATLGAILGAILIAANTGESDAAVATVMSAQALQLQRQINYTRAHEYEADRVGIGMLKDAGFDPEGMASFFEKLQRRTRFSAGAALPEYMRTHPLTRNRITEARNRANEASTQSRGSSRRFYLTRERINARIATAGNEAPVALNPTRSPIDMDFAHDLVEYREAVSLQYRGRYETAANLFGQLKQANPDVISYHLGYAESLMAMEQTDASLSAYQEASQLFPGNETLMESHARSLLEASRPEEALQLLSQLIARPGARPRHHRLLARAASESGHSADSHFHMAGYYEQQGDIFNAITQTRLALQDPAARPERLERYARKLQRLTDEWRDLPPDVRRAQSGRDAPR